MPTLDKSVEELLKMSTASALTLFDNTSVAFAEDGSYKINFHKRFKILKESGKNASEVFIPYCEGVELYRINKAYTITPNGKTISATECKTTSFYPGYPAYRGTAYIMFSMPAIEIGSVIEYDIDIYSVVPMIKDRILFELQFPFSYPTLSAMMTFSYPVLSLHKPLNVKLYNSNVIPVISKNNNDRTMQYSWRLLNRKALEGEVDSPPLRELCPELVVSDFASWDEVAVFVKEIFSESSAPTKEVEELTSEITGGAVDKIECARKIFKYIQNSVRYVAIDFGYAPFQPQKIMDIIKNKYGDCKDSVILLLAMLKSAKIDACPVLIRNRARGGVYTEMPSPYEFNHVISLLKIEGHEIWLDPTDKNTAFNVLPMECQDINAFILFENKAEFRKTPASQPIDNQFRSENIIQINNDSSIQGKFTLKVSGWTASLHRQMLKGLKENEKEEYFRHFMQNIYSPVEISSYKLYNLENLDSNFIFEVNYVAKNQLNKIENLIAFAPTANYYGTFSELNKKERVYDIVLPATFVRNDKIIIDIPKNYLVKTLPKNFNVSFITGSADIDFQESNEQIIICFQENIINNHIKAEQYDEIIQYRDNLSKNLSQQIIFREIEEAGGAGVEVVGKK